MKYQSQYFCQSSLPFAISHLSRGLKSAGTGADPRVTAHQASPRRGWVFDSTLGRQTCSPVFSPVSVGDCKDRRSDRAKGSVATKPKGLLWLWFYLSILFCFSFSTFIFPFKKVEYKMNIFLRKWWKKYLLLEALLQRKFCKIQWSKIRPCRYHFQ